MTPRSVLCQFALGVLVACGSSEESSDAASDARPADGSVDAASTDGAIVDSGGAADASMFDSSTATCQSSTTYPAGRTTTAMLRMGNSSRTFRVHVPQLYRAEQPSALVLLFHGGGGSAEQFETRSAEMNAVADREGFVTVYPDGRGAVRTWNAGGCCGAAVRDGVDDVAFVDALLTHLQSELCLDATRFFAAGMSNGAMLSHRLACELPERFAAVATVAGVDMTAICNTNGRVSILHIHGSSDGHVPWNGGTGCGPAAVSYTSVPETMARWRVRNGCAETSSALLTQGNGSCVQYDDCTADVALCTVEGGGHSWPGGAPGAGVVDCPADGAQSTSFEASEQIWAFFAAHSRR